MQYWKAAAVAGLAAVIVAGASSARVVKGEAPPDFTGTTLDGRKITLSDFRGKNPVVLNFYADFCGPCRREFPHLKELDEKLSGRGLRVIAVAMDEDRATAANIPTENRVRFPVVFDPKGGIADRYGVQAIPHTVVIDREGKVSTVLIGLNLEALDRAVEQVLK
jgi:peroxiredoxin